MDDQEQPLVPFSERPALQLAIELDRSADLMEGELRQYIEEQERLIEEARLRAADLFEQDHKENGDWDGN